MAERKIQSAARLSEDIGDVLSAIRRLIAEDEALAAARDRLIDEPSRKPHVIEEDSAEFLARRHGGNAALARRLVSSRPGATAADPSDDGWPLGGDANGPGAARPRPIMPETPPPPPAVPGRVIRHNDAETPLSVPRNDLARTLSEVLSAAPTPSDASLAEVSATPFGSAPSPHQPVPQAIRPLRLDVTRRVIADAPPTMTETIPDDGTDEAQTGAEDPVLIFRDADEGAADAARHDFEALVEEDDFAEAFDWKARMRPGLDDAGTMAAALAVSGEGQFREAGFPQETSVAADGAEPSFPTTAEIRLHPVLEQSALSAATEGDGIRVSQMHILQPSSFSDGMPPQEKDSRPQRTAAPDESMLAEDLEADEQSIRELLREMIQEELQGEMGQRFSRNLRVVIRREIAAAIDDQLDRL